MVSNDDGHSCGGLNLAHLESEAVNEVGDAVGVGRLVPRPRVNEDADGGDLAKTLEASDAESVRQSRNMERPAARLGAGHWRRDSCGPGRVWSQGHL